MWKRVLMAAMIAISGALIGAGAAQAGVPSTVTIKGPGGDFSGKVKSDVDSCVADRTVIVFKKTKSGKKKIGSDNTDGDGRWSTGNSGQTRGKFYAKVKASGKCDAARSKTIKL